MAAESTRLDTPKITVPPAPAVVDDIDLPSGVKAVDLALRDRLGWKRGPKLPHALKFQVPAHLAAAIKLGTLPASVDLRPQCPAVYDQSDLGSCTANAGGGLAEFLMKKEGHRDFVPSRLFIYYNERVVEGTVSDDSGATLTDCIKVLYTYGTPHESLWWYNTKKYAVRPNKKVYADAALHKVTQYLSLSQNLDDIRACLAMGYPFIFGFDVYSSFESIGGDGVMPMPNTKTEQFEGGHAVMGVGYDNARQAFIVRNSWGGDWGDRGYFYMPYNFIIDSRYADDMWTAHGVA